MIFPFLSFLAVGSSSAQVITWLANLTEAGQIIDYICMCIIYIFFYRALKAQGVDRQTLPYVGWWQPYCAWVGLAVMIFTVVCYGYTTFLPGCKSLLSSLPSLSSGTASTNRPKGGTPEPSSPIIPWYSSVQSSTWDGKSSRRPK